MGLMMLLRKMVTGSSCHLCWHQRKMGIDLRTISSLPRHNSLNIEPRQPPSEAEPRHNSLNIQMLSESLHKQIFKNSTPTKMSSEAFEKVKEHLRKHGLADKATSLLPDIDLKLPTLYGNNINEHFIHIAKEQLKDYNVLLEDLASTKIPPMPQKWEKTKGWTKYFSDGTHQSVACPDDQGLVFDIECLMAEGDYPTMATAVSSSHWYSWTSDFIFEDKFRWSNRPQMRELIPLETGSDTIHPASGEWLPRLIIGHNVGFDRSFVKEQYLIQGTKLKFVDTMSMHIAVCGQTSFQRLLHKASGKDTTRKEVIEHNARQKQFKTLASQEWKRISSMNNLSDVHQLHCGGEPIPKVQRDVFVHGTMADVREQFQELMTYCANDVKATHEVFVKLWPDFKERFPHPVTLAGMLEMGSAFLPVNEAWPRYIHQANSTYDEMEKELKKLLMALADEACSLIHNQQYKKDPWLWDLDWSTSPYRLNKTGKAENVKNVFQEEQLDSEKYPHPWLFEEDQEQVKQEYKDVMKKVYATAARIPKRPVFMPGYPTWYKELCPKPTSEDFYPGPSQISTQCRTTPKLMRLTWRGCPVHYDDEHGWGYLVPDTQELSPVESELQAQEAEENTEHCFPLRSFLKYMNIKSDEKVDGSSPTSSGLELLDTGFDESAMDLVEKLPLWETATGKKPKKTRKQGGEKPLIIGIPGVLFYKIPHKDGANYKVGNPLARDYMIRAEDGTLSACTGTQANRVLMLGRMTSYWKNNQKRIVSQMAVWLNKNELDPTITSHPDYQDEGLYGAIVPRIVTAGTITRRAVEPTWLTASNAYVDRIGSELKGMIQCPPGYHFVGADVDSQELWIAAVLGDAYFLKEHGCTALGWMTLQGTKANKTDLHSKTAQIVNISRDHAKVMNYARIYGAGQTFAERLLLQFNPHLTALEAKRKAAEMYKQTKGQRNAQRLWIGGSESFMFNALEAVANSESPKTPVLNCCISKALEPRFVLEDFLTSRVNWVVQSSAVDYLHLMLVCMRWLLTAYNIEGRFCISIHDEVRYLVSSPDRYRAALALQITNLLTRSMFAYRLGMDDLPQSVAFFSAIDIDSCLRKEVTMDCLTPSNPHGLNQSYKISTGEAMNIYQIIEKTGGKLE